MSGAKAPGIVVLRDATAAQLGVQGIKSVTIDQDAIAVIVNKDNAVEDITMDEIKAIA